MSPSPEYARVAFGIVRPITLATLTATLGFLSLPMLAQSAYGTDTAGASTVNSTDGTASMSRDFVPAQAILTNTLDAKDVKPGTDFEAKLDGKVKLANGTELPSGTMLKGTVAPDDQNVQGTAKLVLRFNSAQLKNGQRLPVRATIVGFEAPGNQETVAYSGYTTPVPNDWTPTTQAVDQIGVTSGVDLHSRVNSQNSGVFVTTNKDDVKLKKGSAINLAIAPAEDTGASAGA